MISWVILSLRLELGVTLLMKRNSYYAWLYTEVMNIQKYLNSYSPSSGTGASIAFKTMHVYA